MSFRIKINKHFIWTMRPTEPYSKSNYNFIIIYISTAIKTWDPTIITCVYKLQDLNAKATIDLYLQTNGVCKTATEAFGKFVASVGVRLYTLVHSKEDAVQLYRVSGQQRF